MKTEDVDYCHKMKKLFSVPSHPRYTLGPLLQYSLRYLAFLRFGGISNAPKDLEDFMTIYNGKHLATIIFSDKQNNQCLLLFGSPHQISCSFLRGWPLPFSCAGSTRWDRAHLPSICWKSFSLIFDWITFSFLYQNDQNNVGNQKKEKIKHSIQVKRSKWLLTNWR